MPSRTTLERLKSELWQYPPENTYGSKGTKACTVCGEDIKVNARKCIKCGCWLTTRRFLDFSSTSLALLTALVSVIGTTAPTIFGLLQIRDSRIEAVYIAQGLGQADAGVTLLISNEGTRMGAVRSASIQLVGSGIKSTDHPGTWRKMTMLIRLNTKDGQPFFIGPHETKPLPLVMEMDTAKTQIIRYSPPLDKDSISSQEKSGCPVQINVVNASGSANVISREPPVERCEELSKLTFKILAYELGVIAGEGGPFKLKNAEPRPP